MSVFGKTVASVLPYAVTRQIRRVLFGCRALSSRHRRLPDFVIAGAQRSGTTTLYNYLTQHRLVLRAFEQEIHFFDDQFDYGLDWYRAHFPLAVRRNLLARIHGGPPITGEASGYYLLHPHAIRRISGTLPKAKLILLLRNPIERAWAHYHQSVRKGESLSFEEALRSEEERLAGERDKMLADETYVSLKYRRYSYLTRGLYADQIKRVRFFFPSEQVLVLKSERLLFDDPSSVLAEVTDFLRLPSWSPKVFTRSRDFYPPIPVETRRWLANYFLEHNQRLYEQEGVDFGWEQ